MSTPFRRSVRILERRQRELLLSNNVWTLSATGSSDDDDDGHPPLPILRCPCVVCLKNYRDLYGSRSSSSDGAESTTSTTGHGEERARSPDNSEERARSPENSEERARSPENSEERVRSSEALPSPRDWERDRLSPGSISFRSRSRSRSPLERVRRLIPTSFTRRPVNASGRRQRRSRSPWRRGFQWVLTNPYVTFRTVLENIARVHNLSYNS